MKESTTESTNQRPREGGIESRIARDETRDRRWLLVRCADSTDGWDGIRQNMRCEREERRRLSQKEMNFDLFASNASKPVGRPRARSESFLRANFQ